MLRASVIVWLAAFAASPRSTFVVPNFRDLTIKTRTTRGLMMPTVTTWYFKGARQRTEHHSEAMRSPEPFTALVFQCDQRTEVMLHTRDKTYRSFTVHSGELTGVVRPPQVRNPMGPDVTITVDSVDTGERRQIGGYEASHFKTTITVDPSKGASRKPAKTEIDGWYLELPGLDCRESSPRENLIPGAGAGMFEMGFGGGHDHLILKRVGAMPHGLPVSQTATERAEGNVIVSKIELLESSEAPLDDSLFEIPADYSPAPMPEGHVVLRNPASGGPVQ